MARFLRTKMLLMEESNRLQKNYRDAAEIDADMDMLQTSIDSLIQNLGIDPGTLAVSQDEHVHPHTNGVNGMNGVNGYTPNGSSDYSTPLTPESYTNGSPYGLSGMHAMGGLSVPDSGQPDYLLDSLLSQIGDGPGRMDGALHGAAGIDYADVTGNYDHSARIDGTSIEDASTEQLTAFLDEASSGSTSSEATPSTASPLLPPGAVSQTSSRPHPPPSKRKVVDVPLSTSPEVIASRKVKRKR
ncbi:hypothetical protein BD414DRAFT_317743 [Trametes punicea]|nr:hypothetical protein BD414DRAFT_317743 [Trametes punicea]